MASLSAGVATSWCTLHRTKFMRIEDGGGCVSHHDSSTAFNHVNSFWLCPPHTHTPPSPLDLNITSLALPTRVIKHTADTHHPGTEGRCGRGVVRV